METIKITWQSASRKAVIIVPELDFSQPTLIHTYIKEDGRWHRHTIFQATDAHQAIAAFYDWAYLRL